MLVIHNGLLVAVFFVLHVAAAGAQSLDLVNIPRGTAQLGDARGDKNEVARQVEISAFRLMRREVTNLQFAEFVADTGYTTTVENAGKGNVWVKQWGAVVGADWRRPQGPDSALHGLGLHPVVQVSAVDAEAFCQHHGLRLPSEVEWEYAARGPAGLRYPWGNRLTRSMLPEVTNAGTWSCCAPSKADGYERTAPVGSFPKGRSPFGVDDMIGNVWEWTSSPFPGEPGKRAIRGGGWGNNPYCLRAAYRHGNPPTIGLDMVGFRCAGDLP
ncbi:MAG: SUMF1/EgtB/PvdO family nonheme iron enzyme [Pseudomonadota bacterium]